MEDERTVVGSSVLSAKVTGIENGMELDSPVRLFFVLNNPASVPGANEIVSRRCAFWNFTAAGTHACVLTSIVFTPIIIFISHQEVVVIGTLVDVL